MNKMIREYLAKPLPADADDFMEAIDRQEKIKSGEIQPGIPKFRRVIKK